MRQFKLFKAIITQTVEMQTKVKKVKDFLVEAEQSITIEKRKEIKLTEIHNSIQ
jgi:hypothetical protein